MPTNYPYSRDIPDANNNPSVDQPDMKINTNSIDSLINEDHNSFGFDRGGRHRQIRMNNQGGPALDTSNGCLYCDAVNGDSWPIWKNSAGTYEIIAFPVVLPPFPDFTQGVVPLAGKMIMQFGSIDIANPNGDNNPTNVSFITPFPNQVCNLSVTPKLKVFSARQSWGARPQGLTQFRLFTDTGVPVGTTFYWQAIGF